MLVFVSWTIHHSYKNQCFLLSFQWFHFSSGKDRIFSVNGCLWCFMEDTQWYILAVWVRLVDLLGPPGAWFKGQNISSGLRSRICLTLSSRVEFPVSLLELCRPDAFSSHTMLQIQSGRDYLWLMIWLRVVQSWSDDIPHLNTKTELSSSGEEPWDRCLLQPSPSQCACVVSGCWWWIGPMGGLAYIVHGTDL